MLGKKRGIGVENEGGREVGIGVREEEVLSKRRKELG